MSGSIDCSTWDLLGCAWVGLADIVFSVVVFVLLAWITMKGQDNGR
jgi:hypothetical protein